MLCFTAEDADVRKQAPPFIPARFYPSESIGAELTEYNTETQ